MEIRPRGPRSTAASIPCAARGARMANTPLSPQPCNPLHLHSWFYSAYHGEAHHNFMKNQTTRTWSTTNPPLSPRVIHALSFLYIPNTLHR